MKNKLTSQRIMAMRFVEDMRQLFVEVEKNPELFFQGVVPNSWIIKNKRAVVMMLEHGFMLGAKSFQDVILEFKEDKDLKKYREQE